MLTQACTRTYRHTCRRWPLLLPPCTGADGCLHKRARTHTDTHTLRACPIASTGHWQCAASAPRWECWTPAAPPALPPHPPSPHLRTLLHLSPSAGPPLHQVGVGVCVYMCVFLCVLQSLCARDCLHACVHSGMQAQAMLACMRAQWHASPSAGPSRESLLCVCPLLANHGVHNARSARPCPRPITRSTCTAHLTQTHAHTNTRVLIWL